MFYLLFLIALMTGCEQNKKTPSSDEAVSNANTNQTQTESTAYISQSSDDSLAAEITDWLTNDYLKDDLDIMDDYSRQFQYFATDLNSDGNDEILIKFTGSWFCGSGGCTFVLVDRKFDLITRFTVMEPPVWAENDPDNDWMLLLVRSGGELKELRYENGSYPSNPSVVKKAPYDAASGSAIVMFDETFAPAKAYRF